MAVLMQYPSNEINGELEARLASRYVPSELIAVAVVATRNWSPIAMVTTIGAVVSR